MPAKQKRKSRPRIRKYRIQQYQKDALQVLLPPENLKVSEWAEKYRKLDIKSSARPGPWRNNVTPYLKEIMDEFNNYATEKIVFCKPTQCGGTESLQNMVGYTICQDPGPAMIVYPSKELGQSVSENRLQPMMHICPELDKRFDDYHSLDLELHFNDMYLTIEGANSPGSLASKPIRYLFLDEVDKYPDASKKEADPISLATERTKTFHNKKIYMTSTPTLKTGHIWKELEACDVIKHYFVPCPHCGEMIELTFKNVRFPSGDDGMSYQDRAEMASYVCQECGSIITDADKQKMLQGGEWRAVKQEAQFPKSVGYWMNTLYSPFVRFSDVALEFLQSKDDPDKLQNFTNSWLAEPWEDTNLKTNADMVLARQTELPENIVPSWAKLLTGGVDVQQDCLYWSIRAWGDFLTSQNVAHGQAMSLEEVERVMNLEYPIDGTDEKCVVGLVLIDSGFAADDIYDFCYRNEEWSRPCKGASNSTMLSYYKISSINAAASKAYGMQLVIVDTSKYKDLIAARMKRENGRGSWMVFSGCDREYAEQVTAEHKVRLKVKGSGSRDGKLEWQLKTSHSDNHYLDTEVYNACAADILGVRTLYLQEQEEQQQEVVEQIKKNNTERNNNSWLPNNGSWLGG